MSSKYVRSIDIISPTGVVGTVISFTDIKSSTATRAPVLGQGELFPIDKTQESDFSDF